jgi:hypothetical protein
MLGQCEFARSKLGALLWLCLSALRCVLMCVIVGFDVALPVDVAKKKNDGWVQIREGKWGGEGEFCWE